MFYIPLIIYLKCIYYSLICVYFCPCDAARTKFTLWGSIKAYFILSPLIFKSNGQTDKWFRQITDSTEQNRSLMCYKYAGEHKDNAHFAVYNYSYITLQYKSQRMTQKSWGQFNF